VYIPPGVYGGEYVKSSGQYHAILPGHTMATPEIYTVLAGRGHFMLQRSTPPYDEVTDAVLVEADAGETFIVPPDYGHLQINPTDAPLAFSCTVMDPLTSDYEPYRRYRGAIYYEMAEGPERFAFNPRYPQRVIKAASLRQAPLAGKRRTMGEIRRNLPDLGFLTRPQEFPAQAYLQGGREAVMTTTGVHSAYPASITHKLGRIVELSRPMVPGHEEFALEMKTFPVETILPRQG